MKPQSPEELEPADTEWTTCPDCGGEGEINRYDEDPLWFGSYDEAWEPCDLCDGEGGWKRVETDPQG